jgi:hypothetical protein
MHLCVLSCACIYIYIYIYIYEYTYAHAHICTGTYTYTHIYIFIQQIENLSTRTPPGARQREAEAAESQIAIQNLQDRVSVLSKDLHMRTQELNELKKHAASLEQSETDALGRLAKYKSDAARVSKLEEALKQREIGVYLRIFVFVCVLMFESG